MVNNISVSQVNQVSQINTKKVEKSNLKKSESTYDVSVIYETSKSNSSEKINGVKTKTDTHENQKQISSMIKQFENQTKSFEKLISKLFSKQVNKNQIVISAYNGNLKNVYNNLIVDSKTVENAKKDISEDGYYGVKQTSERILNFAKAIAGDDPKKLQKMRKAVEKGFKQAEKMWGDKLPEISQNTYNVVMETFDKWQGIKLDEDN